MVHGHHLKVDYHALIPFAAVFHGLLEPSRRTTSEPQRLRATLDFMKSEPSAFPCSILRVLSHGREKQDFGIV